ncbi:hypothetical protein KI387_037140, partial [Taxus chinensis]
TNVAIEAAKNAAVSVAIFAPGWVYENDPNPNFEEANNRWWGLVGQSWAPSQTYPELLPFFSNFDQGHGKAVYIEGQKLLDKPWSNISCQSFQPLLEVPSDTYKGQLQVFTNFKDDSYNGGACITIKGDLEKGTHFMVKLFQGNIALGNFPLHISYYIKSEENSTLGLLVNFSNSLGIKTTAFLAPEDISASNTFTDDQSKFVVLLPNKSQVITPANFSMSEVQASAKLPEVGNNWILMEYDLKMDGYTLDTIHSVSYKGTLDSGKVSKILEENKFVPSSSSTFQARKLIQNQNATESSSATESTENLVYWASLGYISLTSSEDEKKVPPADMWILNGTDISWETASAGERMLNINIVWKLKAGSNLLNVEAGYPFPRYDLYVEKINQLQAHKLRGADPVVKYLGVAVVQAFYASNLLVPPDCKVLRFTLQLLLIVHQEAFFYKAKYENLKKEAVVFEAHLKNAHKILNSFVQLKEKLIVINKQNNTLRRIIKEHKMDPESLTEGKDRRRCNTFVCKRCSEGGAEYSRKYQYRSTRSAGIRSYSR